MTILCTGICGGNVFLHFFISRTSSELRVKLDETTPRQDLDDRGSPLIFSGGVRTA